MTSMAPKLRAERTQPGTGTIAAEGHDAALTKDIRTALEDYLSGRKLVMVKIRQAEGRSIEGFLKIEGGRGERSLVDFKATSTPEGALSSLEVGGRKISFIPGPASRRMQ